MRAVLLPRSVAAAERASFLREKLMGTYNQHGSKTSSAQGQGRLGVGGAVGTLRQLPRKSRKPPPVALAQPTRHTPLRAVLHAGRPPSQLAGRERDIIDEATTANYVDYHCTTGGFTYLRTAPTKHGWVYDGYLVNGGTKVQC
jgi:hypothetical protein